MKPVGLKNPLFWVALILGCLGILMRLNVIRVAGIAPYAFWPVVSGFILLGLMTLKDTKTPSWWIGVMLGVLGLLNQFGIVLIPLLHGNGFWPAAAGFMLLVISVVFHKI